MCDALRGLRLSTSAGLTRTNSQVALAHIYPLSLLKRESSGVDYMHKTSFINSSIVWLTRCLWLSRPFLLTTPTKVPLYNIIGYHITILLSMATFFVILSWAATSETRIYRIQLYISFTVSLNLRWEFCNQLLSLMLTVAWQPLQRHLQTSPPSLSWELKSLENWLSLIWIWIVTCIMHL